MKIIEYIKKQGITVQIFADKCGISRHSVYAFIEQKRTPSLEVAFIINKATLGYIGYDDLLPDNFVKKINDKYVRH